MVMEKTVMILILIIIFVKKKYYFNILSNKKYFKNNLLFNLTTNLISQYNFLGLEKDNEVGNVEQIKSIFRSAMQTMLC